VLPTLVLAAGLGTRLDPLTRLVAKAALPLAGRSLIERVLDWLVRNDIHDTVINLHHRPETIAAAVGDGTQLGARVRYSWEPVLLGSAGGPRHALPLLDGDPLLIVNAEPLCDFSLAPFIAAHRESGADVTLAVVPNPAPHAFNGLRADPDGLVRAVVPKGHSEQTWHFVGVQVARADVFAGLSDNVPAETIAGIYREAIASGQWRIRIAPVDAHPVHVGDLREYLAAAIGAGHACCSDAIVEPGVRGVAASARLRRTVVWPGCRIGPDVDLADCIVVGGVDLPRGFAARGAVIAPAGLAGPTDRVERLDGLALFPLAMQVRRD
jgi:NDP-sugar pyrophosphorylase family protein